MVDTFGRRICICINQNLEPMFAIKYINFCNNAGNKKSVKKSFRGANTAPPQYPSTPNV